MKKQLFSTVLLSAAVILAVYFISCQKENKTIENQVVSTEEQTSGNTADERNPAIEGSLQLTCECSVRTCSTVGPPLNGNQLNGIRIILASWTHNMFNVNGNGLTYTIRQGSNCSGPVVATFWCNSPTVYYANALLQNSTQYSVTISYPGVTPSKCIDFFTSLNCRNNPCIINQ